MATRDYVDRYKKKKEEEQKAVSVSSVSSNAQKSDQHRITNDKSASNYRTSVNQNQSRPRYGVTNASGQNGSSGRGTSSIQRNTQSTSQGSGRSYQNRSGSTGTQTYRQNSTETNRYNNRSNQRSGSQRRITNDKSQRNFQTARAESQRNRAPQDPWEQDRQGDAYSRAGRVVRNTGKVMKESAKQAVYDDLIAANDLGTMTGSYSYSDDQRGVFDRKKYDESQKRSRELMEHFQKKRDESEQKVADITKDATGLEKAIYGAAESGVGMGTDIAFGPLSLAHMGVRSYGAQRGKAQAEGATENEDRLNALLQGAKEAATEKLFSGIGIARKVTRGAGLNPAERLANRVTQNMSGRLADLTHAGIRYGGGIAEENIEELAGWIVDPVISELSYQGRVRGRKKDEIQSMLRQESDDLRSNITDEQSAQAVSAYLSSGDFLEQNKKAYMEDGIPEDQAQAMAEKMRDYLAASLSGDTGAMEDLQDQITESFTGKGLSKDSWSFGDLMDTFAATTLLTGVTGAGTTISSTRQGNRLKQAYGADGIKALANTAIDFEDGEMSLKAQAMRDRIESGKDITATQAADLAMGLQRQAARDNERERDYIETAERTIGNSGNAMPFQYDRNGNLHMDEVLQKNYTEEGKSAERILKSSRAKAGDSSITDTEIETGKKAIAGFKTGMFTVNDANTLNFSNTFVRSAFSEATGVDLNQYVVRDKKGNVDIPATNTATKNALFAMAADNLAKSAEAETQNWMDKARGETVTQISARMGTEGTAALQNALRGLDERDRRTYLMNANAADIAYQGGRNLGIDWEDAESTIKRLAPGIPSESLKPMYEAGLRDREISLDTAKGRQTKIDTAINENVDAARENRDGQILIETKTPPKGSVIQVFSEIARNTGVNIHLVDDLEAVKDKDGNVTQANGQYVNGEIWLNVNSSFEKNLGFIFMHEMTHHLKMYAPEEYKKLEDLVRDKWFKENPEGMQARIARKIESYKKAGQTLTEEEALEEIIADSAHEFLTDEKFAMDICEEEPSLARSIINAIKNALRNLRAVFASEPQDTYMDSIFSQLGILEEAERLWMNAYKQAAKNRAAIGVMEWGQDTRNDITVQPHHTPEQIKIINEYNNAVNPDLIQLFEDLRNGNKRSTVTIGHVSAKQAADILSVVPDVYKEGFDPVGYDIVVGNSFLEHVEARHGAKGKADNTMADDLDKARIGYIIDNYDSINSDGISRTYSMLDKDGKDRPSPAVGLEKAIDGTMVVVEAIPDTAKKQIVVTNAYINKKKVFRTPDANAPGQTADTEPESPSNQTIPSSAEESKRNSISDNVPMSELDKSGAVLEDANGEPVMQFDQDGSVRLSVTSYDAEGRKKYKAFLKNAVEKGDLTQEEADEMLREMETIFRICNDYADSGKYLPFTAWSQAEVLRDEKGRPIFSSVKKNSEYGMNMDFSTICKKRRTLDAVFNEMVKRGMFERMDLNMDESSELVVRINDIIREHGFEAACALCFVEARRYRQQQTATTFANMYNDLVKSLYKDESKISYFNYGRDDTAPNVENGIDTMDDSELDLSKVRKLANAKKNGKPLQTAEAKAARLILNDPSQRKLMRVGDMMSSVGFENFQVGNPDLMKVYNSKKGTGGAKSSFGDVQYLNEIIRSKFFNRMKAYMVSGVRIQSFSDYVPRMVFDYVQMIGDLAAKKLPAHSYTKEVLFAMQFGLTGVKINLSLVPDVAKDGIAPGLDKDGNYLWNEEGTFPWEEARKIQKAEGYKENCGTIAVGISDAQILKMLADPEIQMVIPYHKSSLNPLVAAMTNVDRFEDYTDYQNTKDAEGKSLSGKNDFPWDRKLFRLTHDKEGNLLPKEKWGDPQDLVKEYASWCKKKGYTPKFEKFLYLEDGKTINPGYYKLLEDFALYDNDGNFKPQGDVKMNFPTEESAFGSMASLIESGLEEDAILEGQRTEDIENIVDEIEESAAAGTLVEGKRFSIIDDFVDDNGKRYDKIVLTDTNIFNGHVNRGKALERHVYKNFADKKVTVTDENGDSIVIQFARASDRVSKDGGSDHVVLDKFARKRRSDRDKYIIAHADELLKISKPDKENPHSDEHNHKWLDQNGWDYRKANLVTQDGKVLECILNIANAADGRKILYDITLIKTVGHGIVATKAIARKPNGKNNITKKGKPVKGPFSITDTDSDGNPLAEDQSRTPDIRLSVTEDDVISSISDDSKDTETVPLQDPILEEDRRRMAKSKDDFVNSRWAKWDERWLTEGEILDTKSVEKEIRELVMGVMQNSDTDRMYKKDLVDKAVIDAKKAYRMMKQGKVEEASLLLWDNARNMIESADFVNDDLFNQFKEIRDHLRHTEIRVGEEFWNTPEFKDFRKRNFGRLLIKKGSTNIDNVYMELREMVPGAFPKDIINPEDQLLAIENFLERIQPYKEAYSSEEASALAWEVATDLADIVYGGEEYRSVADKYKEKYRKEYKEKYKEKTRLMKARHREAVRKIREEEKAKRERQRQRAEMWKAREKKLREDNKEAREKAKHKVQFGSIQKNIQWLTKRLSDPTKDQNIPQPFRAALGDMLSYFDMQTIGSKKWEAKHGTSSAAERLRLLREKFAEVAKEDYSGPFTYNGYLFDLMDAMIRKVDGKAIDEMDLSDMKDVDTLLKAIVHNFRTYNKIRLENKQVEIAEIGKSVIDDMSMSIVRNGQAKTYGGVRGALDNIVNMAELTPVYFFKRMGTMFKMYMEVRRGFDKYIKNEADLIDKLGKILQPYYNKKRPGSELESWRDDRSARTFDFSDGTITLTVSQMMSLYCLSKREQALGHILNDGIVVTPIQVSSKMKQARDNFKGKVENSNSVRIEMEELQEIRAALTPEQVEMADQLQKLMSDDMAKLGNEASMEMYGIEMFKDKDYFPIKVAGSVTATNIEKIDIRETIKNPGFAKALTPGARNVIEIDDIFSVVASHCNDMNLYNAYSVPISDFMRVYNYKQYLEDAPSYTVQQAIENAFGKKALTYIDNFMRDINGSMTQRKGGFEDVLNSALGRAKRAAVFANMRVALQQPTAIVRALVELKPKYFIGTRPSKDAMEEMHKYCPIAQWKNWGYYDTHFGRDIEDVMMNNWSRSEVAMSGIYGLLDDMTWSMIWQAVKKEVAAQHPNADTSSEDFLNLCGERASFIFDTTQVVDSPFHRSDSMRSKDNLVRQMTSFYAEPTLTFNVVRAGIAETYDHIRRKEYKEAGKAFNRTMGVFVLQAATVGATAALWDAVRGKDADSLLKEILGGDDDDDKDKEKGYWERWYENFLANFQQNLSIWNNIYVVKDIAEIFEQEFSGYSSNNNLMFQGFDTLAKGLAQAKKKYEKGENYSKSWYDISINVLGGFGYIAGVPIKTLMKDTKPVFDWFANNVFASTGYTYSAELENGTVISTRNFDEYLDVVDSHRASGDLKATSREGKGNEVRHFFSSIGIGSVSKEPESMEEFSKATREKASVKTSRRKTAFADMTDQEKIESLKESLKDVPKEKRTKKAWDKVNDGYKDLLAKGDYSSVYRMRKIVQEVGGDTSYVDKLILEESKRAFKKTILSDPTDEQIAQQGSIMAYLKNNGVSTEEISDIVYHSGTVKDLKAAMRLNDREAIKEELVPLIRAGLTYDDFVRVWENRNSGKQKYSGKYHEREKEISTGTFNWPAQGVITSGYGRRKAPTRGASSWHQGIDIGGSIGDPIKATDGGTVTYAGWNGGYGYQVVVKHADGSEALYSHLDSYNVKPGDIISQGDQIARMGSTGTSTGPHLDFRIRVNGKFVDPTSVLAS